MLGALAILFGVDLALVSAPNAGLFGLTVLLVLAVFLVGEVATLFVGTWDPGRRLFCEMADVVRDDRSGQAATGGEVSAADEHVTDKKESDETEFDATEGDQRVVGRIDWPTLAGLAFLPMGELREAGKLAFGAWKRDRGGSWVGTLRGALEALVVGLLMIPVVTVAVLGFLVPLAVSHLVVCLGPDEYEGLPVTPFQATYVEERLEKLRPATTAGSSAASDGEGIESVRCEEAFRVAYSDVEETLGARARRLRGRSAFYHSMWTDVARRARRLRRGHRPRAVRCRPRNDRDRSRPVAPRHAGEGAADRRANPGVFRPPPRADPGTARPPVVEGRVRVRLLPGRRAGRSVNS